MKKQNKYTQLQVSLVIPVFNNEKTLIQQIKLCQRVMESVCQTYEILISNDKSTDKTKEYLKSFADKKNISIFHQKENLGIAENMRFLYKKAKYKYVILFSIDGDWDPHDIARLIHNAIEKNADVVIGQRQNKDYSLFRKFISILYNALPHLLFQVQTYDTGSIKIFRKEIFDTTSFMSKSVSFEAEMLIKAARKGYKIFAIPVKHKKHKENTQSGVDFRLIMTSFLDLVKLKMQNI